MDRRTELTSTDATRVFNIGDAQFTPFGGDFVPDLDKEESLGGTKTKRLTNPRSGASVSDKPVQISDTHILIRDRVKNTRPMTRVLLRDGVLSRGTPNFRGRRELQGTSGAQSSPGKSLPRKPATSLSAKGCESAKNAFLADLRRADTNVNSVHSFSATERYLRSGLGSPEHRKRVTRRLGKEKREKAIQKLMEEGSVLLKRLATGRV